MFHKEGAKIIFGAVVFSVVALLLTDYISINWLRIVFQLFILLFLVLILQFFRNPKRNTQLNEQQVISSVDGKVVVIEEVEEPEFFKGKRRMVSVFMSPLNVHVTR